MKTCNDAEREREREREREKAMKRNDLKKKRKNKRNNPKALQDARAASIPGLRPQILAMCLRQSTLVVCFTLSHKNRILFIYKCWFQSLSISFSPACNCHSSLGAETHIKKMRKIGIEHKQKLYCQTLGNLQSLKYFAGRDKQRTFC